MNLNDIIALAKQGYKPADIKDLISLAEPAQVQDEQGQTPDEIGTEQGQPEGQPEPTQSQDGIGTVDQSAEIEALKKELADTQKALKTAQTANTRQMQPQSTVSDQDKINDWARSFM